MYMSPFVRIPLGILVAFIGFLIVKKTKVVLEWFGRNDFAETKFGPGGTRFFYKLIGVAIVFIGIAIATNVINDWMGGLACLLTHCSAG